ncbi:hypothetical protein TRFO_04829 [Tritrichomonas foetus]|uniref:Uncharacterized protein n=1 Tax=Tritrichomonas foetus TaxID=1144522 RepID=A0A1J4KBY4_9EUKA|nr:hypothetical protein TRFO_04829 [Tritrichomonas foetus]|eukprot:OHT08731.1 hypothetical protein TRFO_04829 [Tritrichomonas foetus]
MGCGASKVSNYDQENHKSKSPQKTKSQLKPGKLLSLDDFDESEIVKSHENTYNILINRIKAIRCPNRISPPLVMTKASTPIFVSIIDNISDTTDINVRLPIVSAVSFKLARILCFGSYEFLTIGNFKGEDTSLFFRNCFDWLFSNVQQKTSILFIGFPEKLNSDLKRCVESQSHNAEFGDSNSDFNYFCCLAITTDSNIFINREKDLSNFVASGGGLILFYKDNFIHANSFLDRFGINFEKEIEINNNYSGVPKNTNLVKYSVFHRLCTEYKYHLGKDEFDRSKIQELALTLNFYVSACSKPSQFQELAVLLPISSKFQERIDYKQNGLEKSVAILIKSIRDHIPSEMVHDVPSDILQAIENEIN